MDLPMAVIDSYEMARARGHSRADALFGAVSVYAARHPELSISEAGNEVVRILRRAAELAAAGSDALVRAAGPAALRADEQSMTSGYRG